MECRPERGLLADGFGTGIDQVVAVFAVFRPGRHQAPEQIHRF